MLTKAALAKRAASRVRGTEHRGRLSELVPEDDRLLADYADVLAMAQGQNLQGKPLELINRALTLNPDNEKALNLAASVACSILTRLMSKPWSDSR